MRQYLMVYLGCMIQAFAIACILKPNHLVVAGITGLSLSFEKIIGISYVYIYYALCLIILLLAKVFLGNKHAKRIILLTVTYPIILIIANHFSFNFIAEGTEKIVVCIFYAVFMGIGTGLVLKEGFTQGSSDTLSKIIHKKFLSHLSLPQVILSVDLVILGICLLTFSKTVVLYAIIIQYIYSKVISFVMFGKSSQIVKMVIISDKLETIKQLLMKDLGINYSIGYIKNKKGEAIEKVISVCTLHDAITIRNSIKSVDKDAFINMVPTIEAWGKDTFLQKFDDSEVEA